jgi:hypothetical protein
MHINVNLVINFAINVYFTEFKNMQTTAGWMSFIIRLRAENINEILHGK